MTHPELDPLPPGVDRFLRAERGAAEVPSADVARALARFEIAVAVSGGAAAVGAGAAAGAAKAAAAKAAAAHGLKGKVIAALVAKPIAILATATVVGGVVGGGTHALLADRSAPRVVYVDRPVLSTSAQPPATNEPPSPSLLPASPLDPSARGGVSAPPRPSASASATSASARDATSERLLLETARSALGRRDAAAALAAVDAHARRYPSGVFAEEREALAIQALVLSGAHAAARDRGARFHARFPESMFTSSVDAALATLP